MIEDIIQVFFGHRKLDTNAPVWGDAGRGALTTPDCVSAGFRLNCLCCEARGAGRATVKLLKGAASSRSCWPVCR